MNRIAVVILNYNGAQMLHDFLPLVVEYTPEADIYVADNASTDDSVSVIRQFSSVHMIELDRNYGFAGGYNKALKQVDSEYYLLLNSDVEVTPGWLSSMLLFMDSNPVTVACQPKILDYKCKSDFEYAGASGGFIDKYGYPYCRGRLFDTLETDNGQYDTPCNVFWASGAALMVRSAAYWNAGGLDEQFFAHMEEIDLCWRMLARGGEIYVVPQSVVYHVGGATLSKSNPRKTFLNFRNNLLMLYKNLPDDELRSVMRVRSLLDYVAAFKFLLSGEWGNFKAVLSARREYKGMRKGYATVREENMAATVSCNIATRAAFSILWQYYVKGKKKFSQLENK